MGRKVYLVFQFGGWSLYTKDGKLNDCYNWVGLEQYKLTTDEHRLLTAEGSTTLPFVPYPGLYLTFSKPRKRGVVRAAGPIRPRSTTDSPSGERKAARRV